GATTRNLPTPAATSARTTRWSSRFRFPIRTAPRSRASSRARRLAYSRIRSASRRASDRRRQRATLDLMPYAPTEVALYRADALDYDDGLAWQHAAWRAVLDARTRG